MGSWAQTLKETDDEELNVVMTNLLKGVPTTNDVPQEEPTADGPPHLLAELATLKEDSPSFIQMVEHSRQG